MSNTEIIKIVLINDSVSLTTIIEKGFSTNKKIEIIGFASDLSRGRDIIINKNPDILILNIEKFQMEAIPFLRRLLAEKPLPVIVINSDTQKGKLLTLQALESGAIDFIFIPVNDILRKKEEITDLLIKKIKILKKAKIPNWKPKNIISDSFSDENLNLSDFTNKIIVIGTSTGGMEAVNNIITHLPLLMPGIVVTMQLPKGFTKTYADRLNEFSKMTVKEAENGDKITNGKVLIAPGDSHLKIIRSGGRFKTIIENGERINGHRPCIDILMTSIAEQAGSNVIGVLLTGEGNDGALGLKLIKENGGITIAQDENTSIIYEMPKSAIELKVVDFILPIDDIANHLIKLANKK